MDQTVETCRLRGYWCNCQRISTTDFWHSLQIHGFINSGFYRWRCWCWSTGNWETEISRGSRKTIPRKQDLLARLWSSVCSSPVVGSFGNVTVLDRFLAWKFDILENWQASPFARFVWPSGEPCHGSIATDCQSVDGSCRKGSSSFPMGKGFWLLHILVCHTAWPGAIGSSHTLVTVCSCASASQIVLGAVPMVPGSGVRSACWSRGESGVHE